MALLLAHRVFTHHVREPNVITHRRSSANFRRRPARAGRVSGLLPPLPTTSRFKRERLSHKACRKVSPQIWRRGTAMDREIRWDPPARKRSSRGGRCGLGPEPRRQDSGSVPAAVSYSVSIICRITPTLVFLAQCPSQPPPLVEMRAEGDGLSCGSGGRSVLHGASLRRLRARSCGPFHRPGSKFDDKVGRKQYST